MNTQALKHLPEGITVSELRILLSQDEDCCGRTEESGQDIEIEIMDGGGGPYIVFTTTRWAVASADELDWLAGLAKEMLGVAERSAAKQDSKEQESEP